MTQANAGAGEPAAPDRYAAARQHMVEQDLQGRDIGDSAVLAAMVKVPGTCLLTGVIRTKPMLTTRFRSARTKLFHSPILLPL